MHDDTNIIRDACPRCQRREAILNSYADQIVAMDLENDSLRTDLRATREVTYAALDQLSKSTTLTRQQSEQIVRLVEELRDLRDVRPRMAA